MGRPVTHEFKASQGYRTSLVTKQEKEMKTDDNTEENLACLGSGVRLFRYHMADTTPAMCLSKEADAEKLRQRSWEDAPKLSSFSWPKSQLQASGYRAQTR